MRILTWNVNSVQARMSRLLEALRAERPDVVCLQETRTAPESFPHLELLAEGYRAVDHSVAGRNGVAVLARTELPVTGVRLSLPVDPCPGEGRWLEADVDGVRVASVYVPNGQRVGTPEFATKLAFLESLGQRAAELAGQGPCVIAGDVNVCATDADAWDVSRLHGGTHATADERTRLAKVMAAGFVDAFRTAHPDEDGFTWWDYRAGAFHRREGLRIDQVLLGGGLEARLRDCWVARAYRKGQKPSDHAPLLADLD